MKEFHSHVFTVLLPSGAAIPVRASHYEITDSGHLVFRWGKDGSIIETVAAGQWVSVSQVKRESYWFASGFFTQEENPTKPSDADPASIV